MDRFGKALRGWRARRRMSQMELSLVAGVSARHVAFLETGRAQPSRPMVLQLAEALRAPYAARNELLQAAGFAALYQNRPLTDADMAQAVLALDWTLMRHDPYPGFAIDRHWLLLKANRAGARMLSALGLGMGDSFLNAVLEAPQLRRAVDDFPALARHLIERLRTESAHFGGDPVLEAAADALAPEAAPPEEGEGGDRPAIFPLRMQAGGQSLALFSTVAHFSTAEDIALADLKIELMFPADEPTRTLLQRLDPVVGEVI
ncbi:MAG: helix-turn-helix transcriptional regulator [Neomegalonema sp.]|nr:helix-turn-helix transcriptional regulator [Neomegalonema sp.]